MDAAVQQLSYARDVDIEGMEVLVVDDDASVRLLIAMMLKQLGCIVHVANNGREALKILEATQVPVVISDWNMPVMDGIELCHALRSDFSDRYIHLTLLTSRGERADYLEAMRAGADDFAIKPADQETLLVRLVAAQRVTELERQLRAKHKHIAHLYRHMAEDLDAAVDLQRQLLPSDRDDDLVQITSTIIPAAKISGDCQNHFDLPDGRIAIYQADTAGHGIRAALLALSIQRILNVGFCQAYGSVMEPKSIIQRLNNRLQSSNEVPEYFTIFLTLIDPATGYAEYCQAGHPNAAIVRHDGQIDWVGEGGFPVGMLPDLDYENGSFGLCPGDQLVIMTDGVQECLDQNGHQLGEARLEKLLGQLSALTNTQKVGDELVRKLKKTWCRTEIFQDDVSVLVVNRK